MSDIGGRGDHKVEGELFQDKCSVNTFESQGGRTSGKGKVESKKRWVGSGDV